MGKPVVFGADLGDATRSFILRRRGRPENTALTPRTKWPVFDSDDKFKLICCRKPDGTYQLEIGDKCQPGETQQLNLDNCRTTAYSLCCLFSNGATVFGQGTCPSGSVPVPASNCGPPPVVCCRASNGTYSLGQGTCPNGSTAVPLSACQSKVYCCYAGNGQFTLSQTPCTTYNGGSFPLSYCNNLPPQPNQPGSQNSPSGSCSITVSSKGAISWNGLCVGGADTTSPYYNSPNSCACAGGTNNYIPSRTFGLVDAINFDTCDFLATPDTGCCTDNNTQGIDVSTVGPTGAFTLVDENCVCWKVTVRHGLIKKWEMCSGGGGVSGNCGSAGSAPAPGIGDVVGAAVGIVGAPKAIPSASTATQFTGKPGAVGFSVF